MAIVRADIRVSDLFDIAAVTDRAPEDALTDSFLVSHRKFAFGWHTRCVAVGGLHFSGVEGAASAWLIGTPDFDRAMAAGGMRHSRTVFHRLTVGTTYVFNFVPEDNRRTVRWLQFMGLTIRTRLDNFRGFGKTCLEMGFGERPQEF